MIQNDFQIILKISQKVSNEYHNGPKQAQRLAKLSKIVPKDWTQLISKFSEMTLNGPKRFPNVSKSLTNEMVSNDSNIPKMNNKCYQMSSKWSQMYSKWLQLTSNYWRRYRLSKENRPLVIMPTNLKLTQLTRVINDIPGVVNRPQGSYAESFVSISLLLAEIYPKQRNQTFSDHVTH